MRPLCLGLLMLAMTSRVTGAEGVDLLPAPLLAVPSVRPLPPVDPLPTLDEEFEALTLATEDHPPEAKRAEHAPEAAPEVPVSEAKPEKPAKVWHGSFELGLDGTEGNSETFNFRFGAAGKRKLPDQVLSADLDYHKGTRNQIPSAHRMFFEWRQEWLWQDSPWTYFIHGTTEYDEFRAFDVRVALDTGLGYRLVDTEDTDLVGRMGGGASHEVGVADEVYVPELVFGLDLEHAFSQRQKVTATVDYMPDVTDFGDFRLNTKAGWEALIDEEMNLSLKVGVRNQYDSTPHGAEPNDLDYSIVLLWKF